VDGNVVASGIGTTTFNTNSMNVGSFTISAVDVGSGKSTGEQLNVYRSYSYANFSLPNYAPMKQYVSSTLGFALPVVSWNTLMPGIYYVNTTNSMNEYQFNGVVRRIATITPYYQNVGYQGMITTLFWVQGYGQDRAVIWGAKNSGTELYAETIDLASGNVLNIDTALTKSSVGSNGGVDYITNNMIELIDQNSVIHMYNMTTGASWVGNTMGFFEANNEYFMPTLNSIINVEAEGASTDQVVQWQLTGLTGKPIYIRKAKFAVDNGIIVNWVDSITYDTTTSQISWTAGIYGNLQNPPAPSAQKVRTYVVSVAPNGIITPTNLITYATWAPIYTVFQDSTRPTITSDGYALGQQFYPNPAGWEIPPLPSIEVTHEFFTGSINEFLGGADATTIPIPPSEQWIFNETASASGGLLGFNYNNSNYGIAPVTADHMKTSNVITWFWNSSMSEFPSSITFAESGLPNGYNWNITAGGQTGNANSGSSILINYSTTTGSYAFTVPTQTVSGQVYSPIPSSGTASVGSVVKIRFQ
ncbi:MAG: hypothetical protein ACHQX1_02405, partial [Candidatus Micrarchaeales archaeon]